MRLSLLPLTPVLLACAGCAEPVRRALPAPVPLTMGALPVPGNGLGVNLELSDGFKGQELQRTELLSAGISVGMEHTLGLALYTFGETGEEGVGGGLFRIKITPVRPFGPNTAVGLHAALAHTSRRDLPEQDEDLTTYDVALPLALRLDRWTQGFLALYTGPRIVYEDYTDRRQPAESMRQASWGWLAGLHLNASWFNLFAEATLVYVPENAYQGVAYGGRLAVQPALGVAAHLGRPFRWGT